MKCIWLKQLIITRETDKLLQVANDNGQVTGEELIKEEGLYNEIYGTSNLL